jgi:DUF1680 family protein
METGDEELLEIIIRQWERTIARRTYLTGGMGSHHEGDKFGDDFVLPPDRAYSETCADIASVMLAWRPLLATGEPRFADIVERTLFNVVATSPAPDGRAFFYANPLHQRVPGVIPSPDQVSKRASSSLREPWFAVSCCPTNVARTYASLAARFGRRSRRKGDPAAPDSVSPVGEPRSGHDEGLDPNNLSVPRPASFGGAVCRVGVRGRGGNLGLGLEKGGA